MRLSALLLIVFAITCAAEGPFQVVSLEPRGSSGSPGASNALAFLLQKEYVRALAIIDTVYSSEKNSSLFLWPSNQLIDGALYIADIASYGNKYITSNPNQVWIDSPNNDSPTVAAVTSPGRNQSSSEAASTIAKLADSSIGTNGTGTAGDSAIAKINALGALLVLIGAAFALL